MATEKQASSSSVTDATETIKESEGSFKKTIIDGENIIQLDDSESIPKYYYQHEENAGNIQGIYNEMDKVGWYYDSQRSNPITSIRLFTNTIFNGTDWEETSGRKYTIWLKTCDSILAEDFKVQVGNSWTDAGRDIIGDTVNGALSEAAPYRNLISNGLRDLKNAKDKYKAENEQKVKDSVILRGLDTVIDGADKVKKSIHNFFGFTEENADNEINDILNSRLYAQGTQYTYYGGTGVDFGNLDMRFTIFPKISNTGKFLSTIDQVTQLYPYFIGRLIDFKDSKLSGTGAGTFSQEVLKSSKVSEYFKVQLPPAGYQTENKVIDVGIDGVGLKGTFELRIGAFYKVSNLIITNVSLSFSKQMVKDPITANGSDIKNKNNELISCSISPLFCDVMLSFKPASKYSNEALMKFVNGDNSKTISSQLKNNLVALREKNTDNKIY